jgi:two-component system, chemotaxis family, chemotaxis protein CheY
MIKAFLIDDDPIQLRLTELLIKRTQAFDELQIFKTADLALGFLEAGHSAAELPDVILLDLNMPVTDGWMFLSRFAGIVPPPGKKIHIFILSSSIDENEIARSRQYPFVSGFISKPIRPDTLQDILTQLS